MKIGVFVGGAVAAEQGGGFTLQGEIVRALERVESHRHDLVVLHLGEAEPERGKAGPVEWVSLNGPGRAARRRSLAGRLWSWLRGDQSGVSTGKGRTPRNEALESVVEELGLQVIWFLSPQVLWTDLPYLVTVWDLAHRTHPVFPETLGAGWPWRSRDHKYSWLLPKAAFVIASTGESKRQIEYFYRPSPERVRVIPFPTPAIEHVCEPGGCIPVTEAAYVLYPAQFWAHKNHVVLLMALRRLAEEGRRVELVLTGGDKGNVEFIRERATELGVAHRVHFQGFVSRDALACLYANALAMVFPSFFGPDNLPPLEALACGCPAIVGDIPGAREFLGDAAVYVDPTDDAGFSTAIETLLDEDAADRDRRVELGKVRARSWSADDYVEEVLALADELALYRRCYP